MKAAKCETRNGASRKRVDRLTPCTLNSSKDKYKKYKEIQVQFETNAVTSEHDSAQLTGALKTFGLFLTPETITQHSVCSAT
jgi:hypothetical protein